MRKNLISSLVLAMVLLAGNLSKAQQLFFRHLGYEQGMNNLHTYNCAIDKNGFIWAATGEGLVRFNGKDVTYFLHQTHPELPQDEISQVFCDSRNHMWVSTRSGFVRIDEKRIFRPKEFSSDSTPTTTAALFFEDGDATMYAKTATGMFLLEPGSEKWNRALWFDSLIAKRRVEEIKKFDDYRFLIVLSGVGVMLIDTKEKEMETFVPKEGAHCAARFDANSILIGAGNTFGLFHVSLSDPDSIREIPAPSFFDKDNRNEIIQYIERAADHKVYISTTSKGLLCFDPMLRNYTQYIHDPLNPYSINTKSPRFLISDSMGNLMFASVDGVNYTNVRNTAVEYINYLKTDRGDLIHTEIVSLAEDKYHNLWLCTRDDVLIHNRNLNVTTRPIIPISTGLKSENLSPASVIRDMDDKIWVALKSEGIVIFNKDGVFEKLISASDYPGYRNSINNTRVLMDAQDGYVYAGTEKGLFRISHDGFRLDTFVTEPAMRPLLQERIVDILPVKNGMWISSSPNGAAYHYSFTEKKLKSYNVENGLVSNRVYGLTADLDGNIYVGSYTGLSIINNIDSIVNFQKGNGLISSRIESLETADDGSIWIANNYNLLKYDPGSKEFFSVGGRHGLTNVNYVIMASAKLSSGQLAFGTNKGLLIVDPATIKFDTDSIHVFAFYQDATGNESEINSGEQLKFNYKQHNIKFTFAVNDMMIADQVLFRYRLSSDVPGSWSNPSLNSSVDFNLDPNAYLLEVEAYDGRDWFPLESPIRFRISLPWWKQWWFISLVGISILVFLWIYFKGRIDKYRKELLVARQIADLESKALRAQMNPHFVFNSLNAIQECIVTGRIDEAYTYLSKFSKLLRMVLEHSDVSEVSLQEELEVLDLYVTLEKLRFKDDMHYELLLDDELDAEEIWLPPMLIQPHLENAIWHGLRHKEGEKNLHLSITEKNPDYLEVIIEDDGIGRKKAEGLRKNRLGDNRHKSKGRQLSENRMELLKQTYPLTSMIISDLYHSDGEAKGTKVVLSIPILGKSSGTSHKLKQ